MSKQEKSQLNKQTNTTATQQLFTALEDKEQQTIAGGWSTRSARSASSGSFW